MLYQGFEHATGGFVSLSILDLLKPTCPNTPDGCRHTLNYPIKESGSHMKMQKEMRKFCPRCKTHTVQAVALYKKGKDRKVAEGARRHAEDKKGYGGQKFPELKRTAKTTKKMTLRYTCKTCQYKTMKQGLRIRKLEI